MRFGVLDPFHVTKLGLTALDQVRRRVQQDIHGHRGHHGDPLYGIRRILRRRADRLFERAWGRLRAGLVAGDPRGEVTAAWTIAQDLMHCYQVRDASTAAAVITAARDCPVPEIARLGGTLHTWRAQFLAHFALTPRQPPGARVQARRQDHCLADARTSGIQEELVEKRCPGSHIADHRLHLQRQFGFEFDQLSGQLRCGVPVPHPVADGVEENLRERIADQRILTSGFCRARGGHAQRRRYHAPGDLPGVVIGSGHAHLLLCRSPARCAATNKVRGAASSMSCGGLRS